MRGCKKLLSLVLSMLMIVSLIPSAAFAATEGETESADHFTEVVLNEENFPDPKFRESITAMFGVEEGETLNFDDAVKKVKSPSKIEFETDDFTGFNYIAELFVNAKKKINFYLTAPKGRPFPFSEVKDITFKSMYISGAGVKQQIPDISQLYEVNSIKVLDITYGEEEGEMIFDPGKLKCKDKLIQLDILSSTEVAKEHLFTLDLKDINDCSALMMIQVEGYNFSLKDGVTIKNNPSLEEIHVTSDTDKVSIDNCPALYNVYLNGTYKSLDPGLCKDLEEMLGKPENEYGKYMPLETLDVSGCKQKRINVYLTFSKIKEIKTSEAQQLWLFLREGSASIARDDFPGLYSLDNYWSFADPHYEAPLNRDSDGKLYFDMNDIVGTENLKNVDFSTSINEANGFKWDVETGHFIIGDSVSGIKGLNYIYDAGEASKSNNVSAPLQVFLNYINQKPEILLNSDIKDNTITVNQGEEFDATQYAKVKDIEDTKNPRAIEKTEITSNVNTEVLGDYEVTYVAKDSGNLESDPVTLKVVVKEDPVAVALKEAKKTAKEDLTKDIADYDAFKDVKEVKDAVAAGETAIEEAETIEAVADAEAAEKAKITEAVKAAKAEADAKALAEAKAAKTAEINEVVLEVEESEYTSESLEAAKAKLKELKETAKDAVEKAETIEEVEAVAVNTEEVKAMLVTKAAVEAFDNATAELTHKDFVETKGGYKIVATGKQINAVPTVRDKDGNKLEKDKDYVVEYSNDKRVNPGKYTITVKGMGDYYGEKEIQLVIVPDAPSEVSSRLSKLKGGYDDIVVSWNKVDGASGYSVAYRSKGKTKWTTLGRTTKTQLVKEDLYDGRTYEFKVTPYYKDGDTRYMSTEYRITRTTTLKKVNLKYVKKYSSSKVRVRWDNITGERGYQISKSSSKTGTNIITTYKTTKGNNKIVSAANGKGYYYKVRAYQMVDGKKIYAPWSSVKYCKVK